MCTALGLGISAGDFWNEFTPKGILLLVKQRNRSLRAGKKGSGGEAPVRVGRIPR